MARIYKTVKPSGGDYSTLESCMNAQEQDLTDSGGDYLDVEIDGSWTSADTTAVLIHNYTTNSTCYINIYTTATARHAGVWNTSEYRLEITDRDTGAFWIQEDYVRVDGLQIATLSPTDNAKAGYYANLISATNNDLRLSNTIVKGHGHATYTQSAIYIPDTDTIFTCWNCIVYNVTALTGNRGIFANGATCNIYSSTVIGGQYGILAWAASATNVKNCYVGGTSGEDYFRVAGTFAKTNCASEDQSADDTGTGETATNCVAAAVDCTTAGVTFVDPANGDFRVADTDSALYGAGATLTDDPPGSTALGVDIIGTTRS